MVYSTCTFAPLENECAIVRFLRANPDFSVKEVFFAKEESEENLLYNISWYTMYALKLKKNKST